MARSTTPPTYRGDGHARPRVAVPLSAGPMPGSCACVLMKASPRHPRDRVAATGHVNAASAVSQMTCGGTTNVSLSTRHSPVVAAIAVQHAESDEQRQGDGLDDRGSCRRHPKLRRAAEWLSRLER